MKKQTKREVVIEKLETDLSSDELIEAVDMLSNMAKKLTLATGRLSRLNKKKNKEDMTLPELLDEMNFTKDRTNMYIGDDVFSSDIERDFILEALIKEKKVKRVGKYAFDGKKLKKPSSYETERNLQLNEIFHTIKLNTVSITIDNIDFLVLPAYQSKGRHEFKFLPGVWIIAPDEKSVSIIYKYLKEIIPKYSPLRNKFITVDSTGYQTTYTVQPLKPKFSLDDIVLPDEVSAECRLLATMIDNFEDYTSDEVPFRRNIMFSGVPGTGKTTSITAVAQAVLDAKGTVIYIKSASFTPAYELASRLAPALIIIEDFDLLAPDRERYGTNQVTSTALNILDGLLSKEGVLTLVTTNLVDHVDTAAKRAGRIDRGYEFTYPTNEMKRRLIDIHLKHFKIQLSVEEVYDAISSVLEKGDVTGAIIESITRNAKQQAIATKSKVVTVEHVQAAAGCVGMKPSQTVAIGFGS